MIKKRIWFPIKLLDDDLLIIIEKHKKRIKGKITLKSLADRIFSDFIRWTKSNDWICTCITCWAEHERNATQAWGIQNWHYKSRIYLKYRFDVENCYPQCRKCNCAMNWNYKAYTLKMIDMYWLERVEELENDNELVSIPKWKYVEMIKERYSVLPK